MVRNNIVALIDIGSAETKVAIVQVSPKLHILSAFSSKTEGLTNGEITDLTRLKESVHAAISHAEKAAELPAAVRSACLSISGMNLTGTQMLGFTSIKAEDNCVSAADMEDARLDAYSKRVSDGDVIVHRIKQSFLLDNVPVDNPKGRHGKQLAYSMWVVQAKTNYLTELIQIPNQYGMRVEEIFVSSLASAAAVATGNNSDKNRLVVDIGAGTTDYILYKNGRVAMTGVIPVGGRHITNDIANALRISESDAEDAKLRFARATFSDDDLDATFSLSEEAVDPMLAEISGRLSTFNLNFVTALRVEEIFSLICDKTGQDIQTLQLTGGTSQLADIGIVAGRVFGLEEVLLAEPDQAYAADYADPKYSTLVGMAELISRQRIQLLRERAEQSFWTRLKKTFFTH